MPRTVTIGIPVYQGEPFIAETLASIKAQRFTDFQVQLSLDGPHPEVERICSPFLEDPRFQLHAQPERLGWARNIDWLMSRVDTPFWCYHGQDDLMAPDYLEVLVEHAQRHPEAAVVYSDMENFGELSGVGVQTSLLGSPAVRQISLLLDQLPAVAFRGVTRVEALRQMGHMPTNRVDNFAVDVAWMSAMARWGELHRVPRRLYYKRYHTKNESRSWTKWPDEKRRRAWLVHCEDMARESIISSVTTQERRLIWAAAIGRLVMANAPEIYLYLPEMSQSKRRARLDEFLNALEARQDLDLPAMLDADWPSIRQLAHSYHWIPPANECGPTLPQRIWRRLLKSIVPSQR